MVMELNFEYTKEYKELVGQLFTHAISLPDKGEINYSFNLDNQIQFAAFTQIIDLYHQGHIKITKHTVDIDKMIAFRDVISELITALEKIDFDKRDIELWDWDENTK